MRTEMVSTSQNCPEMRDCCWVAPKSRRGREEVVPQAPEMCREQRGLSGLSVLPVSPVWKALFCPVPLDVRLDACPRRISDAGCAGPSPPGDARSVCRWSRGTLG